MPRNENKQRCGARTASGKKCGSWARRGSEPPRCNVHGAGALPQGGKRRCSMVTAAGARCRAWAMVGRDVCNVHAGLTVPGEAARDKGRACSAVGKDGRRRRAWAVRGTEPPLCNLHAGNHLPGTRGEKAGRRCEAVTKRGVRCRNWTTRTAEAVTTKGAAHEGEQAKALCGVHAGRFRLPKPEERRCAARTYTGKRCPHWAIQGTEAEYGRWLCAVHVPEGDARKIRQRFPEEGERRCTARTLDGKRCRHWALQREEGSSEDLCWLHAFPKQHPQIRHGYYRRVPYFPERLQAFIAELAREGEPLAAEVVVMRLKLQGLLAYLGRPNLSEAERLRVTRLIFRGVTTVMKLLQAQKKLAQVEWVAGSAGGAGQLLALMVGAEGGETEEGE